MKQSTSLEIERGKAALRESIDRKNAQRERDQKLMKSEFI